MRKPMLVERHERDVDEALVASSRAFLQRLIKKRRRPYIISKLKEMS